jgi:transposase InsO family protein
MADVSLVDATSRMIVGWQVASEIAVQTVLSLLEVARLRRGAFHGGLSVSLDLAHFDAGSQY